MFETSKLTKQIIEQRREENREQKQLKRKAAKKRRKNRIIRHCCKECGKPKHYICLDHNTHLKRHNPYLKVLRKIRHYARKSYFSLARSFGVVK